MDTRSRHILEIVWMIASLGFVAWGFTNLLSLDKIVNMSPARAAGLLLAILVAPVFLRVLLEIFFPRQARQAPEVKPPGSSLRAGDIRLIGFKDFWPWKKVRFRSILYILGMLVVIVLTGTLLTNRWTIALFLVAVGILTVSVYWYVKQ